MPADIEIRNISRSYLIRDKKSRSSRQFLALKEFSLTVHQGEFVAIVGPSGCGKSTLLDILSGLSRPDSGELLIDGNPVNGPDLKRGFVMQGYALFPWRTVRQNVEYGLEIKKVPRAERRDIADRYLDLVGLTAFAERWPHELSGGMKQRVAIARALAYEPQVLLMDEPFAAVDAQTRENLQEELLKIWEKTRKTIIFITHSIEEAIFLADRVAVMTTNPGTIREVVPIGLARPRDLRAVRTNPDFAWTYHRIWGLLHEAAPAEGACPDPVDVAEQITTSAVL